MRRPRFALIKTTCRRCGTPLYTGNRSLMGADRAKAELGSICQGCTTPEEAERMLREQAGAFEARERR